MKRKFIGLVIALLCVVAPAISAQGNANQGQGLEISPPLRELSADPGETVKAAVRVRNVTNETLVVRAEVNDFTSSGEDGQPKLLLEEGEKSPYSVKEWISTISTITLKSKEQKPIEITMNVPGDASPGGHYGVVRFTGTPPGIDDTGVSLSASIGALVLVNVSGNVQESAKITEVFTSQNGKKRGFFEYGPITLVQRIENTGNVHVKPSGTIRVTDMWSKELASFKFNETGGNVLPASIRKFEQTIDKRLLFGRYEMQADIVYGKDNKIITATKSFWVIPYKLILIILFALAALIFIIRRYNRYIVKKAQRRSKNNGSSHQ